MSSYIIPDSITPRPIKPGVVTVKTIEAIMADGPCAILPVAGDCLEGVDVVDGGWVAVDFTRRPAPPQVQEQGRRRKLRSLPMLCHIPRSAWPCGHV